MSRGLCRVDLCDFAARENWGTLIVMVRTFTRYIGDLGNRVALHLTVVQLTCHENGGPNILLLGMLPHNARRTIMDPTTTFCPNRNCPARGQTGQGNI